MAAVGGADGELRGQRGTGPCCPCRRVKSPE